jgi:hypothetical protein
VGKAVAVIVEEVELIFTVELESNAQLKALVPVNIYRPAGEDLARIKKEYGSTVRHRRGRNRFRMGRPPSIDRRNA